MAGESPEYALRITLTMKQARLAASALDLYASLREGKTDLLRQTIADLHCTGDSTLVVQDLIGESQEILSGLGCGAGNQEGYHGHRQVVELARLFHERGYSGEPAPRVVAEVSPGQARIMEASLDLYMRIGIGQVDQVAQVLDVFFDLPYPCMNMQDNPIYSRMVQIKEALGMSRHGSRGVGNVRNHPDVHVVFDLQKSIQKGIASAEQHDRWSNWHDGDRPHYGDQPTPKVEIVRGEEVEDVHAMRPRKGD